MAGMAVTGDAAGPRPRGLAPGRPPVARRLLQELAPDELGDLVDRPLGRESGRLLVAAAAALPGDDRDVQALLGRPEADPPQRSVPRRRLADDRGYLRALDRSQVVDDPLAERLFCTCVVEVLL